MTTTYCRQHLSFEGTDFGKVHDHLEKDHPELKQAQDTEGYIALLRKIHDESLWTIEGAVRQSDKAWFRQTWGRPPKLGAMVSDSEIDKK